MEVIYPNGAKKDKSSAADMPPFESNTPQNNSNLMWSDSDVRE